MLKSKNKNGDSASIPKSYDLVVLFQIIIKNVNKNK